MLYVPEMYQDFCHKNLIVMERIYGIPVSNIAELEANGTDMKLLAERGVQVFLPKYSVTVFSTLICTPAIFL